MKKYLVFILAALLTLGLGSVAWAADTDTQSVNYEVTAINEISVSPETVSLKVDTATAGSQPTDATDDSTTYAITTNGTGKVITGAIDTAMPTGLTLKVNLADPDDTGSAVSAGDVILSATAADLVTGIGPVAQEGLTITYTLSATVEVAPTSGSKTVTFTVTGSTP